MVIEALKIIIRGVVGGALVGDYSLMAAILGTLRRHTLCETRMQESRGTETLFLTVPLLRQRNTGDSGEEKLFVLA